MLLRLESIQFNHETSRATTDAISIRRNETESVTLPEWQRIASVTPQDSPAAYALFETRGKVLTVRAAFTRVGPDAPDLEIRAVDARLDPGRGCKSYWSALVAGLLRPELRQLVGNVLGEVAATRVVACAAGTSFEQIFELKDVRIWDVGVGAHEVAWRWQYRLQRGGWIDFADTAHRIYTVLGVPTAPWRQQQQYDPTDTQLPWVEALEWACLWAARAKNPDAAAALVTRRVNALGAGVLTYDGSNHYTDGRNFDCHAFLDRLHGKKGNGRRVNCEDCAAIVYTFANLVGCSLSRMSIERSDAVPHIGLKPIIKIGGTKWREADEFFRHAVASEGRCTEDDEVFDACVQVAEVDEPKPEKRVPLVATNLGFVRVGQQHYRSRLVRPEFEAHCGPDLNDCGVSQIGPAYRLMAHCQPQLRQAKELHAFNEWKHSGGVGVRRFVLNYFFAGSTLPDWRPTRIREFDKGEGADEPPAIQSFWQRARYVEDEVLRADVFECDSWQTAREGVAALLTWFQEPGMARRKSPARVDVSFADAAFTSVIFAAGNLVFFLRNVGDAIVRLDGVAESLNDSVVRPPRQATVMADDRLGAARVFRLGNEEAALHGKVLIEWDEGDPLERRRLYQFLTEQGEVSWEGGELVYSPREVGLNRLDIFAVDAHGNALKQQLSVCVR